MAFVGAGGKTAAISTVAAELRARRLRVLVTTTTRLGPSIPSAIASFRYERHGGTELRTALDREGAILVTGPPDHEGKLTGLSAGAVAPLASAVLADVTLVEADGARKRPLKAPADHEPVIPTGTTVVCPVAGLDALGLAVSEAAHRPDLVAPFAPGGTVTTGVVAALLTSPQGGLKGVPPTAAVRPLLNKMGNRSSEAAEIAALALGSSRSIDRIVAGDVRDRRLTVFSRPRS